ncbi:MAG: hypothetical protein LBL39_03025, partial [Planctomycetaceae bacterium]|nr:hypothetical protein [Planctomycetaceae bacterium]
MRYAKAILKFEKLDTQAQQREAVVQGRSLSPYRLRYSKIFVTVHVMLFHRGIQTNRASGVIMNNRWCSEAEPPVT